jgi:hypothetical protein
MSVYTLSMNFIDCVGGNRSHLHNVFLKFPNPDCEHKAAMDKSKRLLDLYINGAKNNVDLLKWLEWMSHTQETCFETININVPEITSEEEVYLMVAAATKPFKKVIVGNHQYWQNFDYINGSNKILYSNKEITILDCEESYREFNQQNSITNINLTTNNMTKQKNNPWTSGSFYLFTAIVIIVSLTIVSTFVNWKLIPVLIIGGIILLSIIGALQLKNDEILKDKSFLTLMLESYKLLPLLNQKDKKD